MNPKKIKIAFTGGGSGGHVYPLLAVIESVKTELDKNNLNDNASLYYFGFAGIYAQEFIDDGIKMIKIIPVKWRRYFSIKNITDIIKFPISILQAFWNMFFVMPDMLFSKGGTSSLPVIFSAWFFHIPIFIHESDTIPGISNKIAYKFAKRVGVSFLYTKENIWEDSKTAVVGNPIRQHLISQENIPDKKTAKRILGFDPGLPLIFIFGGSIGSKRINAFLLDNIEQLVSKYQILHIVGSNNFIEFQAELAVAMKGLLPEQHDRYKMTKYMNKEIKGALIGSDIVISRAGSGTIFELAYFKKPSILIPLKGSAGNHQLYNAYEYGKNGSCVIIEEDNLSETIFFDKLDHILSNKEEYIKMANSAEKFAKPNASIIIANEILRMISN